MRGALECFEYVCECDRDTGYLSLEYGFDNLSSIFEL